MVESGKRLPPHWRAAAEAAKRIGHESHTQLRGLGGWLIFVALFLAWAMLEGTIGFFQNIAGDSDFSDWPAGATFAYFMLFIIDFAVNAGGAGTLLCLFFQKSARFPELLQKWVLAALAWWFASSVTAIVIINVIYGNLSNAGLSLSEAFDFKFLGIILQGLLIWVPYVRKSVRVRNTFVAGTP
jgi:hypothetical protein